MKTNTTTTQTPIHTRISSANVNYINKMAKKLNVTKAALIDAYFSFVRTGKYPKVISRSGQSVTF